MTEPAKPVPFRGGGFVPRPLGLVGPLVFCADLIPGVPWVRRAITMGYDRFPEKLIDEKAALLDDLVSRDGRLFFTHDPAVAACRLTRDERGHVVASAPVEALRS